MRKKKLFLTRLFATSFLLLALFDSFETIAQSTPPTTIWAKHSDGHLAPYTYPTISADGEGNTYVTGSFDGTLTFPTLPSPTILTSAGESDIFVAKYDATGNVVWVKRFGDNYRDVSNAVKYDGFGNIYIGGSYVENTTFETTGLTGEPGSINIYLAKINASTGNLQWVRRGASSNSFDKSIKSIAVDSNGEAYITGEFFKTVVFSPLEPMTTGDWWDIFVVKYDINGIPEWQTKAGSIEPGYNAECGNGIAVDKNGNVFITGKFNGTSDNPTYFGSVTLVSHGVGRYYESDFFLAKYNPAANSWEWAVNGGGTVESPYSADYGTNVSVDNSGAIYVSGALNSETSYFGNVSIIEQGGKGYFIAKYSNQGNLSWVHPTPGIQYNARNSSKVDANGNLYFAGTFGGSITIGDQNLTSNGYDNVYLSAWNNNGELKWVKHIPGNYYSQVSALEVEENGNLDFTSVFSGSETFDCTTFYSGTHADLAVAKLGYVNESAAPIIQASSSYICSGNSATLTIFNGNLNNATDWKWYAGSCGGTLIGSGSTITVAPTQTTTYYARSEGGCGGPGNCGSITISINNTPPVINSVTAPIAPVVVNSVINLTTSYAGENVSTASIKWGDASTEQVISNPANSFVVPHTYTTPGVYSINITLKDACNQTVSTIYQYVVVYDPNGGFVTGGGWINSPAGAYRADVTLTGKAIFGFESKYQKGTTIPSGNTEFKFQVGGMNFKSANYEWLVVSGSRAQFKGSGTINGSGNYGFLLTTVDGDLSNTVSPDLFRIKIWDINSNAIVYDNQYGSSDDGALTTQIGGGSIVIHIEKNNQSITRINAISQLPTANELIIMALPNPSVHYFLLTIKGDLNSPISIRILDVLGRTIEVKNNIAAHSFIKIGDHYRAGVYYAEFIQGAQRKIVKLVKSNE